jgi:succinyl-diaminopimelate desuccinylase
MSSVAKNGVASLARDLIRIESITPTDGGCQDIVRGYLEMIGGFKCETLKYHDVTNLWAYRGDLNRKPLVVFAGHSDVVPPGPLEDWKHHPFEGIIDEHNVLHGRGAVDMKGGMASFLVALKGFLRKHPDHTYSIGLIITSDEEGNAGKCVHKSKHHRADT